MAGHTLSSYLVLLVVLSAAVQHCNSESGKTGGEYCSEDAKLSSKFLVPFYESHLSVSRGCVAETDSSTVVHVLRVNTAVRDVLLTVTDTGEAAHVVLVLQSSAKIRWRLAFVSTKEGYSAERRTVALSPGSTVSTTNVDVQTESASSVSPSPEEVMEWARSKYGTVSTFAEVEGPNRISILLQGNSDIPSKCELNAPNTATSPLVSETVTAYFMEREAATGCFHAEMAGMEDSDVHVLNLESAGDSGAVYISMSSKKRSGVLDRDLTLVLRSARPVKWYLQSQGIAGELTVVADETGDVQNHELAPGHNLIVRRADDPLPGDFASLWPAAVSKAGGATPVSYARMDKANIISLAVTDVQKKRVQLPTKWSDSGTKRRSSNRIHDDEDMAEKTVLIPGEVVDRAIDAQAEEAAVAALVKKLKSVMEKRCDQAETVIAFEVAAAAHYLVDRMTLNDPSCKAVRNRTHWVLKTQSTSCGSVNRFTESGDPMFMNNVILSFSASSRFSGHRVEIPFMCAFSSGFGGGAIDDDDFVDAGMASLARTGNIEEMYKISVSKVDSEGAGSVIILEERGEKADVAFGDQLIARTEAELNMGLNLALDKCWISARPDDLMPRGREAGELLLVDRGCPAARGVKVFGGPSERPGLAFAVTESMARLQRVYIFCLVGMCSPNEAFAKGNLNLCVDSKQHCESASASALNPEAHRIPVAQQLIRRGPLIIRRHLDTYPEGDFDPSARFEFTTPSILASPSFFADDYAIAASDSGAHPPGLRSQHVVMVGVPAEVAVVIALASFIVGAGLTGLLCCIHHRKATPKSIMRGPLRRRNKESSPAAAATAAAAAGTEGSEMQSMLNPSSCCAAGNGIVKHAGGGEGEQSGGAESVHVTC